LLPLLLLLLLLLLRLLLLLLLQCTLSCRHMKLFVGSTVPQHHSNCSLCLTCRSQSLLGWPYIGNNITIEQPSNNGTAGQGVGAPRQ
jgi:hypothetical protein